MPPTNNGNGFKIAFWVMTTVCTVGLLSMTSYVVANDKESRGRDDSLRTVIDQKHEAQVVLLNDKFEQLRELIQQQSSNIAVMQTDMKYIKRKLEMH